MSLPGAFRIMFYKLCAEAYGGQVVGYDEWTQLEEDLAEVVCDLHARRMTNLAVEPF